DVLFCLGREDRIAVLERSSWNGRDGRAGVARTSSAFEHHGQSIADGFGANRAEWIATLAARHNLPAVYPFRYFVKAGGLISYGPDFPKQFQQAATYVDRILKGERPADLPVQAPIKYDLAVNLKGAKALGLTIPPSLLAR